ncbi:hypothetical protein JOF56_000644 [Kibdelosporangium banguiense]|uniref:DUF6545 domain-containing protein n=1 Tax=Kibdelosporangium banguiense TaxID=1365924 RepID=A0ABS4T8K6_9PSEU|nr:MAB_1171c family putative transporter [Kibdelosporangium banguiense]MBP2320259.1 hypothetical protein [Kibdelosporangium banguiense]
MIDWLRIYGPAVLAWGFVIGKLMRWRLQGSFTGGTLWLILIGLACSFTVTAPEPYRVVAALTGVPNLGRLLSHTFILLAAWAAQAMLLGLTKSEIRERRWMLVAAVVAMTVTFALADTPIDDPRYNMRYSATPWVLEYWLVFIAGLAPAFANIVRLCWRYARLSGSAIGKLGLRLIAAGVVVSLLYHVHKALYFASQRFGFYYPTFNGLWDKVLTPVATVLILVGATLPSWGPRIGLSALFDWAGRWRTYQRLRPLWFALYQANPQIALVQPRSALLEFLLPTDLNLRLYRRVIEIRDGRLALQPYLDPEVGLAARRRSGVTGQELDAVVEATTLAAAVDAKRSGAPPRTTEPVAVPGGRDLESDTAFLNDVARAYRKLKLVPS